MKYLSTITSFLFISFISITSIFAQRGAGLPGQGMGPGAGQGVGYGRGYFMIGQAFFMERFFSLLTITLLIIIIVLLVKLLKKKK